MVKPKKDESDDESDSDSEDEDMGDNKLNINAQQNNIDPRKVNIVEQVFEYCYQTGDFKQAIGIAIECRRLDRVQKAIELSGICFVLLLHRQYLHIHLAHFCRLMRICEKFLFFMFFSMTSFSLQLH